MAKQARIPLAAIIQPFAAVPPNEVGLLRATPLLCWPQITARLFCCQWVWSQARNWYHCKGKEVAEDWGCAWVVVYLQRTEVCIWKRYRINNSPGFLLFAQLPLVYASFVSCLSCWNSVVLGKGIKRGWPQTVWLILRYEELDLKKEIFPLRSLQNNFTTDQEDNWLFYLDELSHRKKTNITNHF